MRPRAPWWMWFLASTFILYGAFVVYVNRFGPEPAGTQFSFAGGRMILLRVTPDKPADRAGLRPGDAVLTVDGIRTKNYSSWVAARAQVELNRPQPVEAERDGRRFRTELVTTKRGRQGIIAPSSVFHVMLGMKMLGFALVFLILWQRPQDNVALLAAWLIASGASAAGFIGAGMGTVFRQLPAPFAVLLVFPFYCNVAGMAPIVFTFCALFPRRLFRSTWPYAVAWVPMTALFVASLPYWYRTVYRPETLRDGFPDWFQPLIGYAVYAAVSLILLFVNYRRLEDVNERRRVRVLVAGVAVSWIVVIPGLFALNVGFNHPIVRPFLHPLIGPLLVMLTFAFPAALTYAVLRHRVFDVRVIVRQGLQYAMARRALAAAVPVLAVLLLLDLMAHGQQTIAEVLRSRGWVYGVLAALALLAHSKRQSWLDALDRRFFRERYDAQRLLRAVVDDLRSATSFEIAAAQVVGKIEAALHAEFVALYLKAAADGPFAVVAASPAAAAPPALAADAKFIGVMRLLGNPMRVSSSDTVWQQLPTTETRMLQESRIDLLVPVAVSAGKHESLLALGGKRSEEPYSREDLDLLASIASSLALLLERPQVTAAAETEFRQCAECGLCYEPGATTCSEHDAKLLTVHAPRTINGRYRLEKCIGQGGMGAVYAAMDTALERRVAAKLVREELIGRPQAAERFRREAKAAAGFMHPNVVTVHDFGLSGGRAFLIMELLEGHSLRQELHKSGRLESARLLAMLRGVCSAVEAAHRRGLIHRDLKPENIFLAQTESLEVAKILDFGLVKSISDETKISTDSSAGVLLGTVPYMSPEQLRGDAPAASFDLWALSILAYECLSGALPYTGATAAEWARAVNDGRMVPITSRLPQAPAAWQQFFLRALSPEPQQRPSSAQQWYAELENALAQRGAAAAQ